MLTEAQIQAIKPVRYGKHRFGVTMREWEAEQGRPHAGIYLCPLCSVESPVPPHARL
jgi:hypothetical protein